MNRGLYLDAWAAARAWRNRPVGVFSQRAVLCPSHPVPVLEAGSAGKEVLMGEAR